MCLGISYAYLHRAILHKSFVIAHKASDRPPPTVHHHASYCFILYYTH